MTIQLSVADIAQHVNGKYFGDGEKSIAGIAPFETAEGKDLTLAGDVRFLNRLETTRAGAVLVPNTLTEPEKILSAIKRPLSLIITENPRLAWTMIMQVFYPPDHPRWEISPHAVIGQNFVCGENADIAPYVVIEDNVTIGNRATIYPHVYIGRGVSFGDDVVLYPSVTIREGCCIGNRVIIHANTAIGSDGFGFTPDKNGKWHKIPQTGIVVIEDDVEIGSLNTIDRATFGNTRIGSGVKTDKQVHIGHNTQVGENSIIVAQVGIAGSVTIGKNVTLAAKSGVAQHLKVGDGAIVGPCAGLAKDIPATAVVSGRPSMPHRLWLRVQTLLPRLPEFMKKLTEIEKRLAKLENNIGKET